MPSTNVPRAPFLAGLLLAGLVFILVILPPVPGRSVLAMPRFAGTAVAGPIAVAASLDRNACLGTDVAISASVTDAYGTGVQGAMVTGVAQYGTTAQSFSFPATGADGISTTQIHTGQPEHGTQVTFSIDASAGGYVSETQVSCYAAE